MNPKHSLQLPIKVLPYMIVLFSIASLVYANSSELNECPNVYYRSLSSEKQALAGLPIPSFKETPSCVYKLKGTEISMGVFHCKKYENNRLKTVAETWGKSLRDIHYEGIRTYLLASKAGVAGGSAFPMTSLIVTEEPKDDYLSTLPKGILGLAGMYARDPDAKWFGVVGDDVYIDSKHLTSMLSAFDPDEEWCIADAHIQTKKKQDIQGSSWRISGGAPIITSRALTKRLLPYLKDFSDKADRRIVHDLQFTVLMGLKGGGFHKITHVDGLYSQGPGVYIGCPEAQSSCPKTKAVLPQPFTVSSSRGKRWHAAAYHHITEDSYMRFLESIHHQSHICKSHNKDTRHSIAVGRPITKFQPHDDSFTKYVYFDVAGQVSKGERKTTRQAKQMRSSGLKSTDSWARGMSQVGPAFIAASMYQTHPDASWFLVAPMEEAFVNIQAVGDLIDSVCHGWKGDCISGVNPIVIARDKSLNGVVLVSRAAAKEGVLASGLLGVNKVVFRAVESMVVIKDMVAYQKERLTQEHRRPQTEGCALVFSTNVPLAAMHWGKRESPLALANVLLRPPL